MPRSILAYLEHAPGAPHLVLALHANAEDAVQGLAFGRSIAPDAHVIAPSSPRPLDPRYGQDEDSHTRKLWFFVQGGFIEPTLFGETLRQIELMLHDLVECERASAHAEAPVWVVGRREGGVLALALAVVWPELIDRVVVEDAIFPSVPGWQPEHRSMTGVEVELRAGADPRVHLGAADTDATRAALEERGASVVLGVSS